MTVTDYRQWLADGSPWHCAAPIESFAATLRRYGYTVGTIGAVATHLDVPFPQDHAPFSHTPWPGPQPYPAVLALDVMPGGALTLPILGAQILSDRQAGTAGTGWIKYMNWTDGGGSCWEERWEPAHARVPSSDRGHIHLSARTDWAGQPTGYDPVARHQHPGRVPGSRVLALVSPPMSGDDVVFVQHQIGVAHCGAPDGVFGAGTVAGVLWFQRKHRLTADGVVGPRTWAALGVTWTG